MKRKFVCLSVSICAVFLLLFSGSFEKGHCVVSPKPEEAKGADASKASHWDKALQVGLALHVTGKCEECFGFLKEEVFKAPPTEGMHRCLALMGQCFSHCGGGKQGDDMGKLIGKDIKKLAVEEVVVIASVIRSSGGVGNVQRKKAFPYLDRLIQAKGKWADWASWEKAGILSEFVRIPRDPPFIEKSDVVYCASTVLQKKEARASYFRKILEARKGSYMIKFMQEEISYWRISIIQLELDNISRNQWFAERKPDWGEKLAGVASKTIEVFEKEIALIEESFGDKWNAEYKLGEFLYGDDSSPRLIVPYLKCALYDKELLALDGKMLEEVREFVNNFKAKQSDDAFPDE